MSDPGLLLVFTGPSGCGKTTLVRRAMAQLPELRFSVSYTTRARRGAEVDGEDYHFVDLEDFEARLARGEFLEHALVHGNRYGTHRNSVETLVRGGAVVLLDIDVQGARQVRASGADAVFVFLLPPSMDELELRLRGRGTDASDVIDRRLAVARSEIAEAPTFDYRIVNDDLERAEEEFLTLVHEERQQRAPSG